MSETVLEIHLPNLRHNYQFLRKRLANSTKLLAVVKAFGYGSDAVAVAKCIADCGVDYFGVAYVREGIALREAGITQPILVMHPQQPNLEALIAHKLEPAIYSHRILKAFLAVLKRFGKQNSNFSFPMEGYSLALDFPINKHNLLLMKKLDEITIKNNGRFYLAKDSRMSKQTFQKSDKRIKKFNAYRDKRLKKHFNSSQSKRLGI